MRAIINEKLNREYFFILSNKSYAMWGWIRDCNLHETIIGWCHISEQMCYMVFHLSRFSTIMKTLVYRHSYTMMTSSNGNIFRVTGPLCGEFTGPPVNSPHKGQWRGALMFPLICVWINDWVNNREAGDLRRYRGHYDVTVMTHANHVKLSIQPYTWKPHGLYSLVHDACSIYDKWPESYRITWIRESMGLSTD